MPTPRTRALYSLLRLWHLSLRSAQWGLASSVVGGEVITLTSSWWKKKKKLFFYTRQVL